jgi:hypothetical protein
LCGFFPKKVAKKKLSIRISTDGQNSAVEREKSDHFIPPRLTRNVAAIGRVKFV